MALINPAGATPFGFSGLQTGLQFATGQDNLFDASEVVRQSLIRDTEFNIANQLLARGRTTPEIAAAIGQNSPFLDRGLSRLSSAASAQQALAPSAILAAQRGNFDPINRLQGFFGPVGNFNRDNFNTTAALPLFGAQGVGAQLSINQNSGLQNVLLQQLLGQINGGQDQGGFDRIGVQGNNGSSLNFDPFSTSNSGLGLNFGVTNLN